MSKMERKLKLSFAIFIILTLIAVLVTSSMVSASLTVRNWTFDRTYQGGDYVKGWINFSFSGLAPDSYLITNFGNRAALRGILDSQGQGLDVGYSCSIAGCSDGYTAGEDVNQIVLSSGVPQVIGFRLFGEDVGIKDAKFNIQSDAPASCIQQIYVAVAGEENASFQNYNSLQESCGIPLRGCFNSSLTASNYQLADLSTTKYCERILLPTAPAVKLSANITNSTTGTADLKMGIYNLYGDHLASCNLPKHVGAVQTEERSCVVEKNIVQQGEYFICLSVVPGSGATNYKIRTERAGEICGTDSLGSDSFTRDYEVYAQPMKYGSASIVMNKDKYKNVSDRILDEVLEEYIGNKYGGNCSGVEGCFVPFTIFGASQTINLNQAILEYTSGNTALSVDTLSSGTKINSTMNSKGTVVIDITPLKFALPLTKQTGVLGFSVQEGNNSGGTSSLISLQINISQGYNLGLSPLFAPVGIKTAFKLTGISNISKVEWDFGDGSTKETSTNPNATISHLFAQEGSYNVKASVEANAGVIKISKTFNVSVGDAKSSAQAIISKYEKYLANFTTSFSALPQAVKQKIEAEYSPVTIGASLNEIKGLYNSSATNDSYSEVIQRLMALNVPMKAVANGKGKLPVLADENSDFSVLESLSAGREVSDNKATASAINSWVDKRYNVEVEFTNYGVQLESGTREVTTRATVSITKKASSTETENGAYLVMGYPLDAISFESSYGQKGVGTSSYVPISGAMVVSMLLPSEADIQDLGIYLSPDLSKLTIVEEKPVEPFNPKFPWSFYLIWTAVLVVVFFVVYILLQEWYKKYYEHFLFANKDDLYNLLLFIDNGRKAGKEDHALKRALNDSGWSGEQLDYAFKKIDGKRTGMWEIPIFNFMQKKEVAEEIEKRRALQNSRKVY